MKLLQTFIGLAVISFALSNNIALNKPSTSSHVGFGGVPERGNDGDTNNVYSQNSCVLAQGTSMDPNPWWQVNLEEEYYILSVAITNRGDAFEWRLHDFTIEVYSENPTIPGAVAQICYIYNGTVGSGATEELTCTTSVRGQYVRIQKNWMLNDDALQFCELEVFGKQGKTASRAVFSRHHGQRLPGTPIFSDSKTAPECGRICFKSDFCDGFNFIGGNGDGVGTCQFMLQVDSTVADVGCDYYQSA